MFSLLYGLWEYLFRKAEFHVLILGIDKAGKTTMLEKIKSMYTDLEGLPPDKILPTVGLNIGRVEAVKSKLIFWDLGGQIGLRSIWDKYYEEAHAVLYVVDAAGAGRMDDAREALDRVLAHQELAGAPLLVMANKQDLPGASGRSEVAEALELRKYSPGRETHVQPVCAFTGEGLEDGVSWLVETMKTCPRTMLLRQKEAAAAATSNGVYSTK